MKIRISSSTKIFELAFIVPDSDFIIYKKQFQEKSLLITYIEANKVK